MSPARLVSTFALAGLLTGATAHAAELTPEQVAKIRRDEKLAQKKVDAAHGNRKSSEMDNVERRAVIDEKAAAVNAAYQANGVSAKEFAQHTARMTREEERRAIAEEKRLDAQAEAEAAKRAGEQQEPGEIEVQQGFNDQNPVDLEQAEGAEPKVDYGTSAEVGEGGDAERSDEAAPADGAPKKPEGKSRGSKSGGR